MRKLLSQAILLIVLLSSAGVALAQTAPVAPVPAPAAAAAPQGAFDPVAATDAYMARLSPEKRARSDAYFEGGYWLTLWSFLYGLGVAGLLLGSRLSARMRDLAGRATRFRWLQSLL
jgi:STE24 endopeptidase